MKKILLLTFAAAISLSGIAQGKSKGVKSQGNAKSENAEVAKSHEDHGGDVINGNGKVKTSKGKRTTTTSTGKYSKNQPSKVRSAFAADYPNIRNVTWSKYKGDWTATFNNGYRRTAVYHANGERRDTRTYITKAQLPRSVWDIFRRDRVEPVGNIVQIQAPSLASEIFRVGARIAGAPVQYKYYTVNGQLVQYDY